MMPKMRDVKLKEFARHWLNGPLPAILIAELADILEDEDYPPEKRVHQVVWQAVKYGLEHTPKKKELDHD